jgi:hypothetical protein
MPGACTRDTLSAVPQERAARAKELPAERIEKRSRVRVLDAIRKKLPGTLARPDFEMAALDYFRRLGHDNHRRLCRVYGWEEKKSKASWGGMSYALSFPTSIVPGSTLVNPLRKSRTLPVPPRATKSTRQKSSPKFAWNSRKVWTKSARPNRNPRRQSKQTRLLPQGPRSLAWPFFL